jgi:ClpP class serine protease
MKVPDFFSEPQFLAVTINSPGGDVVQAKNIARILKNYSIEKKYKTPL